MATLTADNTGKITGKFTIADNKYKAGTKQVQFFGAVTADPKAQSHAETTFTGMGTVVTNTLRNVNNIMMSYYDPLAQTFMLDSARQLCAVEVFLVTAGTTSLIVQLRETSVGFPTRTILAEGRIDPTDPAYGVGKFVKVRFDKPYYASANVEYAVVVLANDAATAVGISELGKADIATKTYVTSQPYQIGVLLSSANASTWTAHQDKDLTFNLYCNKYDEQPRDIELGTITLDAHTTDLLISALTTTPATGADADLTLSWNQGTSNPQSLTVSDGQVIKLTSEMSGEMSVKATLRCTKYASATIEPGTQIIGGVLHNTGSYITRRIPIGASSKTSGTTHESTITVTMESLNAASIDVYWVVPPDPTQPQTIPTASWNKMVQDGTGTQLTNGNQELVFKNDDAKKIPMATDILLRIVMTGNPTSRGQIFNLRASVVEVG